MPLRRHEMLAAAEFARRHAAEFAVYRWCRGFDLGPIENHQGEHLRLIVEFDADPGVAATQRAEAQALLAALAVEYDGLMREALAVADPKASFLIPIVKIGEREDPAEIRSDDPPPGPVPLGQLAVPGPEPDDDYEPDPDPDDD